MALFLLTIAMFGHAAWGNITLPAEVFPTRAIGTVTGLGGAFGGLAGVLTQLAIGRTVQAESFTPIFVTCGVIYLSRSRWCRGWSASWARSSTSTRGRGIAPVRTWRRDVSPASSICR